MSLTQVVESIQKHRRFLITTHTNVEGDALGSQLSCSRLLKALGKQTVMMNDELPLGYDFLPGIRAVKKYERSSRCPHFDALVVVDCSDLARTGAVSCLGASQKTLINIDHHISNTVFGSANWVDPTASSASEMVYRLYKKMGVPIDRDTALLLYVGIMTDTGSFRFSNTTARTLAIASELVRLGVDVSGVYKEIYASVPFNDMKLLTEILPTMRREQDGKLIWFQIEKDVLRRQHPSSFDLSEHILTFGRSIKGAEAVVLFKENLSHEKEVRVNFRSQGRLDVNAVARLFGGGGHKSASGATIKGALPQVESAVLAVLRKKLRAMR